MPSHLSPFIPQPSFSSFIFPPSSLFNKVLPKNLIYKEARPTKKVKDLFVLQVKEIVWKYKLSPDTTNLPKKGGYTEIQVFEIQLKTDELAPVVLATIDKAIPYPIIFRLCRDGQIKVASAYKRPAADGTKKWVVDGLFQTEWTKAGTEGTPLPIALNMKTLYEQMMLPILGKEPRNGEQLPDMVQRLDLARKKERELQLLESRLRKEKQFNRKVEINAKIRTLSAELSRLIE
ncbi:MAG: DUF4391 domain-containing protein [Pontiella sp.]